MVEDSLLMPLQRLQVYELMFRKLLQNSAKEDDEFKTINQAIEMLKTGSIHIDDKTQNAEGATAVLALQNKVVGCPITLRLYNKHRKIIRKGLLTIGQGARGSSPQQRMVYLANDMLLWTTPDHHYKGHAPIECVATEVIPLSTGQVGIRLTVFSHPRQWTGSPEASEYGAATPTSVEEGLAQLSTPNQIAAVWMLFFSDRNTADIWRLDTDREIVACCRHLAAHSSGIEGARGVSPADVHVEARSCCVLM